MIFNPYGMYQFCDHALEIGLFCMAGKQVNHEKHEKRAEFAIYIKSSDSFLYSLTYYLLTDWLLPPTLQPPLTS